MAKNGVEAEQSSYYRQYPVAFGQKREIVGVGLSDTANNITQAPILVWLDGIIIGISTIILVTMYYSGHVGL